VIGLLLFLRYGPGLHGAPNPSALAGLVVETDSHTQQIHLPDGSTVVVESATRLEVVEAGPGSVQLALDRGQIACEVSERADRSFVVDAHGTLIRVRGTKFTVTAGTDDAGVPRVAVSVQRGSVDVRQGKNLAPLALLLAGQSWASSESASHEAELPPEPPPPPAPVAPEAPGYPEKASPVVAAAGGARALFAKADAARGEGRLTEAVRSFEQLWRRYPKDGRAGLAAFEAGRIRLEALDDARDAADDFAFAAKHTEGTFREDAEAGGIEALARAGDVDGCRKARRAFLATYPESAQAGRVRGQCP